ncbi:hypothetical protein [Metabacillus rhizolycopersici]|uniref:Bacitracin ABC transporter ATP-binding protein n=1 Tax=Metabacillus rhizolycopersici TaxID=2875709 RepID=A0ABS7UW59_9BACI|nr:hypothetical protein [Metabacillus rhizolycopersici]MBZ5752550.1 bacitracin ABC transporter ATP-binding protein [Metabacillus rhizolycopersici]
MSKKSKPLLSEEFLDEIAREINELYGEPNNEQKGDLNDTDVLEK